MNVETIIKLDRFKPRSYQLPVIRALESGKKKLVVIMPRRAGKDVLAFNIMIREALKLVGVYFYIFPTYSQGKKIIWDSILTTSEKFLSFIPDELIASKHSQDMKITLLNGSIIQVIGSDNIDSIVGTNPRGCVFSEYALQSPLAYQFIRPILTANNGWCIMISTPRGKNHMWELYNVALNFPEQWFAYRLTLDDTQHIPLVEIERERSEGIMSDDLIQQEYYCSFDAGIEGAYYTKYMDKLKLKGQIGQVPWEPGFKVNTCWDIGIRDSTTIIFYQIIGQTIRIVDCYDNSKVGLEHYISVLRQKERDGYVYGKHIAPHDIAVREFTSGMARIDKARQLGVVFTIANDLSVQDGIEAVRSTLPKMWFDEVRCRPLIKALENYRQEYDVKKKVYKPYPLHDWSSHFCFTGDTLILTRNGMRQIMLVQENDEVLTLQGWKKCSAAFKTIKNAQLVEVSFTDGTKVKCTPDHLFLTTKGWHSAKSLQSSTKIRSSLTNSLSTLMGNCIEYGQEKSIYLQVEKEFIERRGNSLLELFRKTVTYTIETMIPLTTISGISNVYQRQSILNFLDQITKDLLELQEIRPLNGIDQMLEDCGIKDLLKERKIGPSGKKKKKNAFFAEESLRVLYEEMDMPINFATPTAKHLIIESVKFLDYREDVYDITVPGFGYFSLSNGAIVHNSDAMRYLCISLPKTRDGSSPEELDKRYRSAMYGEHNVNMPSVFRDDLPQY